MAAASSLASQPEARAVVDCYTLTQQVGHMQTRNPSLTTTAHDRLASLCSLAPPCITVRSVKMPSASVNVLHLNGPYAPPRPCPRQGSYALDPAPGSVARDLLSYLGGQLRRRVALVPDVAAAGLAEATPVVGATKVGGGLAWVGGEGRAG